MAGNRPSSERGGMGWGVGRGWVMQFFIVAAIMFVAFSIDNAATRIALAIRESRR